ncbi:Rha family transcriptional regulator [Mesorhizobium sp. LNJC403B00]|uniref:Rha family transcriptional regulator n=1 Tax=Mesorhizobium sp. LNJC403B00 TaxID=1287280 RepID=UPI0003CDEEAD|nr:Rha family transcriptional regulator [Mesorhizobium sp. LNJC403B00]ESX96962.1 Rha family transcriptional regulator [Mesorhizobium sp. LNJC403B00]
MVDSGEQQLTMFDAMKLLNFTDERLLVDSLAVAERFGKLHKNVLRDVEGIECSEEFYRLNFEPIEYEDNRGRLQPMFRMTRDGFSLLVMGFTGPRAMRWKERYIQAFNMMEAELLHVASNALKLGAEAKLSELPQPIPTRSMVRRSGSTIRITPMRFTKSCSAGRQPNCGRNGSSRVSAMSATIYPPTS